MRTVILNDVLALVAGRDGYFLINRKDRFIGSALEHYGEFSGLEAAFLKRLIKPGDHVVEVGANIGSHTIGLAKTVGPQGKVYAFEPQRACYALLQAQIALNQVTNVYAYNEGIGRQRGRLFVPPANYAQAGNFGGIALTASQTEGAEAVNVRTLDERLGDAPCALIKIDVEGMEEDVIHGAAKLIRRRHPLLYVENDRVEKSRPLVALILSLGYRIWWHIPRYYSPDNFFASKADLYPTMASFNMICARESGEAMAGLLEIKSPDDPHPLAPRPPVGAPARS